MRSKIVRSNFSAGDIPATPVQRPEPLAMKERRRRYGWDESDFFSRHWKKLAIYGSVFFAIIFLLMIFFWPRTVRIAVKQVAQAGDENYELTTVAGLIEVSLLHNLETVLENPNFASIRVRRASVKGQWVMRHGNRPFFGNGTMEEKLTIPARSSKTIQIPYSVFFAGDPTQDELYLDFLTRCTQRDKNQRLVQIEYLVRADLSYFGIPFSRELNYSYKVPCPLPPSHIGAIIKASGVNLQDITLKEVGQNLKEIIEQDEALEKIEAQAADKADGKTTDNKVREKATVRKAEQKAAKAETEESDVCR
jgi:ribosomal protein L12E/L44/L45/RPP1/RPP2